MSDSTAHKTYLVDFYKEWKVVVIKSSWGNTDFLFPPVQPKIDKAANIVNVTTVHGFFIIKWRGKRRV